MAEFKHVFKLRPTTEHDMVGPGQHMLDIFDRNGSGSSTRHAFTEEELDDLATALDTYRYVKFVDEHFADQPLTPWQREMLAHLLQNPGTKIRLYTGRY